MEKPEKKIYKVLLLHDPQHPRGWPIVAGISRGKYFISPDDLPERVCNFLALLKENSEVWRTKATINRIASRIREKNGDFSHEIQVAKGRRVVDGRRLTLEIHYLEPEPDIDSLPEIDMGARCDGAKWGLADWYPEVSDRIEDALKNNTCRTWTTGWYGSKKEIASARISRINKKIVIEASVSDDFDTNGYGRVDIPHTTDLGKLKTAIDQAHDVAENDRERNLPVELWAIKENGEVWVETFLRHRPVHCWDCERETPPGDCYHEWGFQGDTDLPEEIKTAIENKIMNDESPVWAGSYLVEKT